MMGTLPKGTNKERDKYLSISTTDTQSSQLSIVLFEPRTSSHKSASWLWYLGFRGSVVRRKVYKGDIFSVSIRYRPTAAWNRHPCLILVDFAFRLTSDPWKISTLCFNLMSLNIIPENAEIIQACKHGFLEVARTLFRGNTASIYDVTSANDSLLYVSTSGSRTNTSDMLILDWQFAIDGGHLELVRLLLDEGADANQTFGQNQTYVSSNRPSNLSLVS
jgi:hypothetical protein